MNLTNFFLQTSNKNINKQFSKKKNQEIQYGGFFEGRCQIFTFRIYEIYKGKYWFHSKNFEKFFLLKTCFLPIKRHKP
jgi:hypothetical protein